MKLFSIEEFTIHKPFLFFFLLSAATVSRAQFFPARHYPAHYFIYPVKAKISLAANFGELRPNHYHMGLDCRTDQAVNKHVVAAADGYIARVTVEPFGYGQAIYINHPNGLTTVYGHLNQFFPALEKYVREQQYEQQKWNVNLDIPPGMFPVRQGQFIAFSGSTGGSSGPHTHFEIRDTKTDKVLNEMLFGLPIPDKVAPTIARLAMYDRTKSTYSQSPAIFALKRVEGGYTTRMPVIPVPYDKISFGITATDRQSGSQNPNGIYEAVIYLDGVPLSGFRLDSISYAETRYVNAHVDYKTHESGGPYIEHLSRLPGYPPGVYRDINGDGVICLKDRDVHEVRVVVKDTYSNTSVLTFHIQKRAGDEPPAASGASGSTEFQPGEVNVFEDAGLQVYLPEETLYDSVAFSHSQMASASPASYSPVYSILSGLVPSEDFFTIRLKADKAVPAAMEDKMLIRQSWKGRSEVSRATEKDGWYSAEFNQFGEFELLADDEPPLLHVDFRDGADLSHYHTIVVTPVDNNGKVKGFRAELDGKWLMFSNDKGQKYVCHFDDHCPPGKHLLTIAVEDEAGNRTVKNYHFTR